MSVFYFSKGVVVSDNHLFQIPIYGMMLTLSDIKKEHPTFLSKILHRKIFLKKFYDFNPVVGGYSFKNEHCEMKASELFELNEKVFSLGEEEDTPKEKDRLCQKDLFDTIQEKITALLEECTTEEEKEDLIKKISNSRESMNDIEMYSREKIKSIREIRKLQKKKNKK